MSEIYFPLTLNNRYKSPKRINIKCGHYNISHLNCILKSILKNLRLIKSQKCDSPVSILKLLDKIIPHEYFGPTIHRKQFYRIVKTILTQSCFECIHISTIIKGYNYSAIPWLTEIQSIQTCTCLLKKTNLILLERVVKPLIVFYYKPLRTYRGHEIRFIRLEKWNSIETKIFNQLQKSQFVSEVKNSTKIIQARGYLKIIPKGSLEDYKFRVIVNSFHNSETKHMKVLASKIHNAAMDTNVHFSDLYHDWCSFVTRLNGRGIFGIKLDVKDAYGNVNISTLCEIVSNLPSTYLSENEKILIINHVKHQFVVHKSRIYEWRRGLLQGEILSGSLCELYMTYLDMMHIPELASNSFMHRTVDDYFFCSTKESEVANFRTTIEEIHIVNEGKTRINCDEIPYCGKIFNMKTKEVRILYDFNKYAISHRFKLWNIRKPIIEADCKHFLRKAMSFSLSSNYFSKMELNTIFNSQRAVLENFFNGIVYVAYKFDAAVMAIRNNSLIEDLDFVATVLDECVFEYVSKVLRRIQNFTGCNYRRKISFRLLEVLAYKAFILVFKRRNEVYRNLITHIKQTNTLKIDFRFSKIDLGYFRKLPVGLEHVTINRKNIL